jgi:hypothetical protein
MIAFIQAAIVDFYTIIFSITNVTSLMNHRCVAFRSSAKQSDFFLVIEKTSAGYGHSCTTILYSNTGAVHWQSIMVVNT